MVTQIESKIGIGSPTEYTTHPLVPAHNLRQLSLQPSARWIYKFPLCVLREKQVGGLSHDLEKWLYSLNAWFIFNLQLFRSSRDIGQEESSSRAVGSWCPATAPGCPLSLRSWSTWRCQWTRWWTQAAWTPGVKISSRLLFLSSYLFIKLSTRYEVSSAFGTLYFSLNWFMIKS